MILSATVIPYRGAWLEYETDANDVFYVRIDKNRKIPITSFIRAIGVKTDAEIKELFGEDPLILATLDKDRRTLRKKRSSRFTRRCVQASRPLLSRL